MIAYEIQLRYAIRDKIQSETKSENIFLTIFFPIIVRKEFLLENKLSGKKFSDFVFDWILSLGQIDAYHHWAVCTYRNET